METVYAHEMALLSEDVYDGASSRLASGRGWKQLRRTSSDSGFAANLYERNGLRVLAVRGTEPVDIGDLAADVQLAPPAVKQALLAFLVAIGAASMRPAVPLAMAGILRRRLGRLPSGQFRAAESFVASLGTQAPQVITGHSLGGALAMGLSQRMRLPAMAFNAPFIGDLDGVIPMTSPLICQVVRVGCPVAGVTQALGALPIGKVIRIEQAPPSLMMGSMRPLYGLAVNVILGLKRLYDLHSITPLREALQNRPDIALRDGVWVG